MAKHLSEYLDYYQNLDAPGYAVLVAGEWGVGKTHQVRQCIKSDDCYYVSLFGVKDPAEAHAAVYAAYAPKLDKLNKIITSAGGAAENAGGIAAFGGPAANFLSAIIRKNLRPDRTIIFDDLERCCMRLEELMGVVSTYVEILKFRVVIVADEDKLLERYGKFSIAKEKIVGHTLKVTPSTSEAFDAFAGNVGGEANKYIKSIKNEVLDIFDASGCMSLRVLRHVIFDLARLWENLSDTHLKNSAAMSEIIGIFVSCGIEIRLGRIAPGDLKNRAGQRQAYSYQQYAAKGNEVKKSPFILAVERYPTIDLENNILDDQVLGDVYEHGRFDRERIVSSINRSQHFARPEDIPAWKYIIKFDKLDNDTLEKAISTMGRQFEKREVTSTGDMLHMFSLRLMMAQHGILGNDINCVRDECLSYVADLLAEGRMPPRELEWTWCDIFENAYDGYGYWVEPIYMEHFEAIWNEVVAARVKALEAQYPAIVAELLDTLKKDGVEFYRKVCEVPGKQSAYALIPVFTCIDPAHFVDAWLAAPRPAWQWVKSALEARLEPYRANNELASERSWGLRVLQEIKERRDALSGFERLRLERVIPNKLRQLEEVATSLV
ncbi:P-loop NTPase family protein [Rhodobacter capsulatus]|uniref:hypothetical protein n=1 Tax=Rhodobacter capsulatus TaxID=1061 RepID=UPI00041AB327|nr:hypothetical protein [Rhodobacter capsulatus]